jgi:hypothetical protein
MTENELSGIIIDAAIEVHRDFGERVLRAGVHRVVNGLPEDTSFFNAKTQVVREKRLGRSAAQRSEAPPR